VEGNNRSVKAANVPELAQRNHESILAPWEQGGTHTCVQWEMGQESEGWNVRDLVCMHVRYLICTSMCIENDKEGSGSERQLQCRLQSCRT
jgi:hypothetical protein